MPKAIEAANLRVKLFSSPIEPSWVIEGNPQARSCLLSRSADELGWTAVWECTEGKFNWYYHLDETILILEGSIILESGTLPPTRYGVGDVILFREGAQARWHVENYVKKLAFGHRSIASGPVGFGVRALRSCKTKLSSLAQQRNNPLPHGLDSL
ncbi:cupin domain-containing protein [Bradyrhizobium sp.]|uniref:cupin domain-containing protein n=1 Tax=Bradyrhizobium sp. TaxID=376 RepID=UPI0026184585|nr:cupin domain-containing protein [Bradyrhizobium sp.]